MKQYNIMMTLASTPTSALYNQHDGSHHRGASHHAHFWNGYEHGTKYPHLVPGTTSIAYCVWRAGVDFKTQQEKKNAQS
jgi:hypothetical protein